MNERVIAEISSHQFKVRTGDAKYATFSVEDLFKIDETNIAKEMANQAALYAYFTNILARADRAHSSIEGNKEREYATTDLTIRQSMEDNGKKATETQVKSYVIIDEDYRKLCLDEVVASYDVLVLKSIVRALEQRAEMLISLGAHLRHEMDMTGLNIRERKLENAVSDAKKELNKRKQV